MGLRSPDELRGSAAAFAEELNTLLNRTVTDGPVLTAVTNTSGTQARVAYGITRKDVTPTRGIPLTLSARPAQAHLHVFHLLTVDEDDYLTAATSVYGLFASEDLSEPIFRFDYERGKGDGYPEAHLHVYGECSTLPYVTADEAAGTALDRLHFPVGGRRFRPSLEDVVDFLVTEGFCEGRDGWQSAVDEGRDRFAAKQLRAAVRRNPEIAADALRKHGDLPR